MKQTSLKYANSHNINQPAYPNAADRNYFSEKSLEILTAIASGLGCIAGMVFFVIIA